MIFKITLLGPGMPPWFTELDIAATPHMYYDLIRNLDDLKKAHPLMTTAEITIILSLEHVLY